jgi:hypothetical protein
MTLTGIDLAWSRPTVDQIKATGAHWVARYFSNDDSKDLHASEVTAYPAAGLSIVAVWETTTGRARDGRAAGIADAQNADAQRKAVGLPSSMPIHFAVDEDTTWASVAPYFAGVASVIGQARTGVYGGYQVIEGACAAGYRYLWQTVAWSGGLWSAHATIRQTGGTTLGGAADWDTAMAADFGQYPRPTAPQETDMTPDQAAQLKALYDLLTPYAGWGYRNADADAASVKAGKGHIPDAYGYLTSTSAAVKSVATQISGLTAAVNTLAGQLGKQGVDTNAVVAAVQQAISDAVVNVHVDVTNGTTPAA